MPLHFQHGDITTLTVDAIVNAANEKLQPGGGVCGAIFQAAGPQLEQACSQYGSCATGEAVITPGFALPAKYIIHTELNSEAGNGGLIAVDKDGNIAMEFNSTGMYRGYLYKNEGTAGVVSKVGIGENLK